MIRLQTWQAAGRAGALRRSTARSLVKQTSVIERDFYDALSRSDLAAHVPLIEDVKYKGEYSVRTRTRTRTRAMARTPD